MKLIGTMLACGMLLLVGCRKSDGPEMIAVSGVVQFDGSPVEEGQVSFLSPTTGLGGQGNLTSGGKYQLEAPAGTYEVSITPPLVTVDAGPNTPPSEEYKKVDNIPAKYRVGATSGFTVTVAADKTTHDFALSKK